MIKLFRKQNHYLLPLASGFIFLLIAFCIDEYKINATRDSNYFMLLWIWLGFANATYYAMKQNVMANAKRKPNL